MTERGWLREVLNEAQQEVEQLPAWTKEVPTYRSSMMSEDRAGSMMSASSGSTESAPKEKDED